jgi:hypothetical protein
MDAMSLELRDLAEETIAHNSKKNHQMPFGLPPPLPTYKALENAINSGIKIWMSE